MAVLTLSAVSSAINSTMNALRGGVSSIDDIKLCVGNMGRTETVVGHSHGNLGNHGGWKDVKM